MQIHEITLKEATGGAGAFGQMAQRLAPAGPTTSGSGGTITPTATGLRHTSGIDNPNVIAQHPETAKAQQQWDIVNQQLRKQYPGQSEQQYQQAMLKKMGYSRPGVFRPTTTSKAKAKSAPSTPAPSTPAPRTPAPRTPAPAPAPATPQYPPITLGTGPKAQVFVNKGRGYVDSKTNKPMPPAIVKAMGLQ
jgi:cell division protein FtsN